MSGNNKDDKNENDKIRTVPPSPPKAPPPPPSPPKAPQPPSPPKNEQITASSSSAQSTPKNLSSDRKSGIDENFGKLIESNLNKRRQAQGIDSESEDESEDYDDDFGPAKQPETQAGNARKPAPFESSTPVGDMQSLMMKAMGKMGGDLSPVIPEAKRKEAEPRKVDKSRLQNFADVFSKVQIPQPRTLPPSPQSSESEPKPVAEPVPVSLVTSRASDSSESDVVKTEVSTEEQGNDIKQLEQQRETNSDVLDKINSLKPDDKSALEQLDIYKDFERQKELIEKRYERLEKSIVAMSKMNDKFKDSDPLFDRMKIEGKPSDKELKQKQIKNTDWCQGLLSPYLKKFEKTKKGIFKDGDLKLRCTSAEFDSIHNTLLVLSASLKNRKIDFSVFQNELSKVRGELENANDIDSVLKVFKEAINNSRQYEQTITLKIREISDKYKDENNLALDRPQPGKKL